MGRKKAQDEIAKEEQRIEEMNRLAFEAKLAEIAKNVIVTMGDLKQDYEIVRPIFIQISNVGIFSSKFHDLEKNIKVKLRI